MVPHSKRQNSMEKTFVQKWTKKVGRSPTKASLETANKIGMGKSTCRRF